MNAVISNARHPEYGQVTIPLPIPAGQYEHMLGLLDALKIGDTLEQDCQVDELPGCRPILKRLEGSSVNIDELDYLAKRLDSFIAVEDAQFQGMAVKLGIHDIRDFIDLTFCCQEATVITDFSDLEKIGKDHIMTINRELYDIEVNPEEAATVKEIFDLADNYGYGGRRISSELKAKGIVNTRTGEPFHYSSIQNILKNIMYMGILRSGETQSEIFPELQIITPEQFARIDKGRQQRLSDYEQKCAAARVEEVVLENGTEIEVSRPPRSCPKRNSGKALLSGNVFCGHCGGRIFASTARKSHHPTAAGTNEHIPIYKCYNRTQHKELCDGPTTYRAGRVDEVVESLLRGIFERAKTVDEKSFVKQQIQVSAQQYQQKLSAPMIKCRKTPRKKCSYVADEG